MINWKKSFRDIVGKKMDVSTLSNGAIIVCFISPYIIQFGPVGELRVAGHIIFRGRESGSVIAEIIEDSKNKDYFLNWTSGRLKKEIEQEALEIIRGAFPFLT